MNILLNVIRDALYVTKIKCIECTYRLSILIAAIYIDTYDVFAENSYFISYTCVFIYVKKKYKVKYGRSFFLFTGYECILS